MRNSERTYLIKFSIIDTGIGISKENQKKLFKKFTQADNTTTRKFGGTGLGLAISKELTELMGGTIDVKSKINIGSTFWFSLKLKKSNIKNFSQKNSYLPATKNNHQQSLNISQKDKTKFKILLSEDNKINIIVAKNLLSKLGYKIDISKNGKEAISKLKEKKYDLILMDMQMPIMGGIEATKFIRSNIDKDIPIIAITANALEKDREICLKAGMNDFLTKPLLKEKVINMINKYLT